MQRQACARRCARVRYPTLLIARTAKLIGLVLLDQRLHQGVEMALQYFVEPVQGQVDAMVGDPSLGKVVGANALRAVSGSDQVTARLGLLRLLFGARGIHQLRLQQSHGPGPVLVLGAFVLAFDHDARRQVRQAYCRVGLC